MSWTDISALALTGIQVEILKLVALHGWTLTSASLIVENLILKTGTLLANALTCLRITYFA